MLLTSQLLKATLKRAPFTVFSKTAPAALPKYDVDTDFCYYFFNDNMQYLSGISPHFLTANNRNAKTDFPVDYEQYFEDDAAVCQEFPFPRVKVITEPWSTPAMVTTVETRKTAMKYDSQNFMLGCFGPHDDIELGITSFRATVLPPALDPIQNVPDDWYKAAFQQLPLATILVDLEDDRVVAANDLADASVWQSFLEQIKALPNYKDYECYQMGTDVHRAWAWRPDPSHPSIVAISVRNKHTVHPEHIAKELNKK